MRRHQPMARHRSCHARGNTDSKLVCLQLAEQPCRFRLHRREPTRRMMQGGSRNRPPTRPIRPRSLPPQRQKPPRPRSPMWNSQLRSSSARRSQPRFARPQPVAARRTLPSRRVGRPTGVKDAAVRDGRHVVRQCSRREAPPDTRADLFSALPEAGGRRGSARAFFRDLPAPPQQRARADGTLVMGDLALRADPI